VKIRSLQKTETFVGKYSAFDILGPVMIGPSSSHTAGAARLGKIAGLIAGDNIVKVEFILHGSFARTYKGHGTDRALVAGILGMDPWNEDLRESIEIAKKKGLEVVFTEGDLGDAHPNTVKFVIKKKDGSITEVVGSSIGGGSIVISQVDGDDLEFSGEYTTIIVKHRDRPGMVSKVTSILSTNNYNIAFMKLFRSSKGKASTMVFEMDSEVSQKVISEIEALGDVISLRKISPVSEGV